jgi:hypothetical protein
VNDAPRKPRTDWDRITAIAAMLIGLVAVGVAAYTALLQREQIRAQVWPRMVFYNAGRLAEFHVGNKGNGPAIVRNVRVLVDGKPVTDWAGVYRELGLASDAHPGYSSLNNAVLAPGDDSVYLQPADRATFEALRRLADTRWVLEACYCSALDECWIAQAHPRRAADITRETDACPATDPARDFID